MVTPKLEGFFGTLVLGLSKEAHDASVVVGVVAQSRGGTLVGEGDTTVGGGKVSNS